MPYEKKFGSGLYGGGNDYIIDNLNGDYDRLVQFVELIQDLLLELSL